ncbi:MAG: CHC2 zinc finger domain-containing protein [bacterium]
MVDFDQILARVTIRDVLAAHGHKPVRNRMPCPIHDSSNRTSFSFEDSTFCCFSCGVSGGLIDLVQYLHHCQRREALRHLCSMAGLPFDDNQPNSPQESFRPRPMSRINPLLSNEEYLAAKNRQERLKTIRAGLDTYLRIIRRSMTRTRMSMEDFYPREEVVLYELEEMDSQVIEATWERNAMRKRITGHGNTRASRQS